MQKKRGLNVGLEMQRVERLGKLSASGLLPQGKGQGEGREWTHHRSAAAAPSGSPSHSFSSDCSRYSSAQRAGDTDKGSASSR